jgi:quercetin dioxygenase-like cupin family protein
MSSSQRIIAGIALSAVLAAGYLAGTMRAEPQPAGAKTFLSPGGTQLKVLVDAASLGGSEVEIAELTFAPNTDSGNHRHAVTETFYVLEGEMEQVVNDKPIKLGPGMVASIRSTDQVRHQTGSGGARVLVIWAPGGEIARVTAKWKPQL